MLNIIPKPTKCIQRDGYFILDRQTCLFGDRQLEPAVKQFNWLINKCLNYRLELHKGDIYFAFESTMSPSQYEISVGNISIQVKAGGVLGAFYAVETLRQLFEMDFASNGALVCPCCLIQDKPRFTHRGLSLDIARHFYNKEDISFIIDQLARLKMNVLHLHLCDDQGFRVQIDKYPQLNQIGSYREGTSKRNGTVKFDTTKYGGYLTKIDVAYIVDYARRRNVDIIPEIDIPGHTVAMIASCPQLSCKGEQVPVSTRWGISKTILCAGKQSTYQFLYDVLDEVCQMFPSRLIHLGGDEAPKDSWKTCPDCMAKLQELGLQDYKQLQAYMFNQIASYLSKKGKTVICWNDCLSPMLDQRVIVQHWTNRLMKSPMPTIENINGGRKAIISHFDYTYFDYPYCRTPLRKVYTYNPILKGISKEGEKNVIGMECCLWTEFIDSRAKLEFNLFPRLLAFAEKCWSSNADDYDDYLSRSRQYYRVLDRQGINYARNMEYRNVDLIKTARFFLRDANAEFNAQPTPVVDIKESTSDNQ